MSRAERYRVALSEILAVSDTLFEHSSEMSEGMDRIYEIARAALADPAQKQAHLYHFLRSKREPPG